ncbi:LysR family transcriptional regulator [Streptococcus gallinaceus]|uniref:DNA-binding transcriptional LysR family regulator n=1 Tax=Streptococcus gallinaceus TaxID=165758 RepID=A0ABV2JJ12_9STRE|nr:LysR family transcriptional regulator [Streptococcus gallinaceus]MCP1639137.1 DNA-binding transcriptional LysR family regulator [Streptococcus gallinaceus]MCP1769619.1 DNA-binding transcriptional LysR family regulator [Streptococcus gallinaceus]
MNLQHLEYFIALAKTEHMTRTAQELNTSQPNLSYMISELEKELGVPLFKKTGRNIRLTRYGKIFYDAAEQSLSALKEGNHRIQAEIDPNKGLIHLGFIYTMGIEKAPALLKQFMLDYPDVHFDFEQNNSKHLLQLLMDEKLDLAFVSKVDHFDAIRFEPLTTENLVLVVPEQHPLATSDQVSLEESLRYDYVYYNQSSGLRPYLDQTFDNLGLKPTIKLELESDLSILGFVSQNFGIAIMPDIPSINSFPVKKITILNPLSKRIIYLALRQKDYISPLTEKFKQYSLTFFEEDKKN